MILVGVNWSTPKKRSCIYDISCTKSSTWSDLGLIPVRVVGGLANILSCGTSESPLISVFISLLSVYRTPHGDHDRIGQTQESSWASEVMVVLDNVKERLTKLQSFLDSVFGLFKVLGRYYSLNIFIVLPNYVLIFTNLPFCLSYAFFNLKLFALVSFSIPEICIYSSLLSDWVWCNSAQCEPYFTVLGSFIEIILVSCTSIFSKFIMRNLHVTFSSSCEFRENRCKEGHDFLTNVNKITLTHVPW
jgi:hypothetical protein